MTNNKPTGVCRLPSSGSITATLFLCIRPSGPQNCDPLRGGRRRHYRSGCAVYASYVTTTLFGYSGVVGLTGRENKHTSVAFQAHEAYEPTNGLQSRCLAWHVQWGSCGRPHEFVSPQLNSTRPEGAQCKLVSFHGHWQRALMAHGGGRVQSVALLEE